MSPIKVREILESITGDSLPHLEGCRHIVVAGLISTGRTTLLSRLLPLVANAAPVEVLDHQGEIMATEPAVAEGSKIRILSLPRHESEEVQTRGIRDAVSREPGVLMIGEISLANGSEVLALLRSPTGPSVIAKIYDNPAIRSRGGFMDALDNIRHMGSTQGPTVAVIRLERVASTGARIIARVDAY